MEGRLCTVTGSEFDSATGRIMGILTQRAQTSSGIRTPRRGKFLMLQNLPECYLILN
ncbi:hypothetical protein BDZ89DRAFT_1016554 [Hymenopellis radicata]|nr:hypothetical protein BDZ89DRAFT_1016554 [Hymenopellis radicata]